MIDDRIEILKKYVKGPGDQPVLSPNAVEAENQALSIAQSKGFSRITLIGESNHSWTFQALDRVPEQPAQTAKKAAPPKRAKVVSKPKGRRGRGRRV